MATVKENLIAAKALIADPANWLQHTYGGDGKFDASEAVFKSAGADIGECAEYDILCDHLPDGHSTVSGFNDDPNVTHTDVMALFDRAIAAQDEVE